MKIKLRKCFLVVLIVMLTFSPYVFALSYSSPSFVMKNARIVVSGGKANSSYYSLTDVSIGNIFGAKSESANYSLDAANINKEASTPPSPPTINSVVTPTNVSVQSLSGTKDRGSSIYINGYQVVQEDYAISWSCDWTLSEGDNYLIITARNSYGLESDSVYAIITLDTVPPEVVISSPPVDTLVYTSQINIEGSVDGASFIEQKQLDLGINLVLVEKTDQAGNISSQSIEIYRAREPIGLPVR